MCVGGGGGGVNGLCKTKEGREERWVGGDRGGWGVMESTRLKSVERKRGGRRWGGGGGEGGMTLKGSFARFIAN